MRGVQLIEVVDVEEDFIEIKKEKTDLVEESLFEQLFFLCAICGKTHSKNVSCVIDYGIFKTEVFTCFNQECGEIFKSKADLEQHGNSCQVTTDPPLIKTDQDEDVALQRPSQKECYDCLKTFKTQEHYFDHMRIIHPKMIRCCLEDCNRFFKKHAIFEKHLVADHNNFVFCDLCGKGFKSKSILQEHLLDQHFPQKVKTPECGRSGGGKSECLYCRKFFKDVGLHITRIHPEKCLKCLQSSCHGAFLTEEAMQKHFQMFHVPTKCDICQKRITSKYCLETHISNHHKSQKNTSNKGKTECCFCGQFVQNILGHIKTLHPKNVLKCSLSNCKGKLFDSEQSLSKHLQQCHSSIQCFLCEEMFERKYLYVRHVSSQHRGTIKCSFLGCIHFFNSYPEMEKHYKANHPFQAKCDLCGHLAPTKDLMFHHIKRRHYPTFEKKKERMDKCYDGRTECVHCGKFIKNISVHLRRKHAALSSCCKEFVTEAELQKHRLQAHSAIKCIYCTKVFDQNFLYIAHVYKNHQSFSHIKCSFRGCIHFFKSYLEMKNHYTENHPLQAKCDLCGYLAPTMRNILHHMKRRHRPEEEEEEELPLSGVTSLRTCPGAQGQKSPQGTPTPLDLGNSKPIQALSTLQEEPQIEVTPPLTEENTTKLDEKNTENITVFETCPQVSKDHCTFGLKENSQRQMDALMEAICTKCGKKFPFKGLLDQHKLTCFYQCLVCGKKYKRKWGLKYHELTHKVDWKGLKYQALGFKCDECRKYYGNEKLLKMHMNRVHYKPKFKCDLCNKEYSTKYSIANHMIGPHNFGTEVFKCQKCPKTYNRITLLQRHEKSVHGGVAKCGNCGKMFNEYFLQTRHSKFCLPSGRDKQQLPGFPVPSQSQVTPSPGGTQNKIVVKVFPREIPRLYLVPLYANYIFPPK